MSACSLANNQGGESHALAAAASPHFPIQRGIHPSPTHSTPQPAVRSGPMKPWEKIHSRYGETGVLGYDLGRAVQQWPLSVCSQDSNPRAHHGKVLNLRQIGPGR